MHPTLGLETGVGKVRSLRFSLADFQLGLLEVLLLFLLFPVAGAHLGSVIWATTMRDEASFVRRFNASTSLLEDAQLIMNFLAVAQGRIYRGVACCGCT